MLKFLPTMRSLTGRAAGFTMIELLIVITILGILAVAVLSAINPIEQINRGRDTGKQSDAEQMVNAIERYNAFQGYAPWSTAATAGTITSLVTINSALTDNATSPCTVIGKLSTYPSPAGSCVGTDELKVSYISRITTAGNELFLYSRGNQGDSSYACFIPKSKAFAEQANTRCLAGLPSDLSGITSTICPNTGAKYVCLP